MQQRTPRLTFKAIFVGVVLIFVNAYWTMMGLRWDIAHPAMISLLYNAVFVLFPLTLLSLLLRRISPRFALSRAELLTIYVMVCLTASIAGHMCVQMLIPVIGHATWFATPENDWQALFGKYTPDWIAVQDKVVLSDLYKGYSTFYTSRIVQAWLTPLLLWSAFLFAIFLIMLCINFIVRKQWTENEKLSYPLIQLPLAMTHESRSFFKDKLMWLGFGIVAFIDIVNGLNYLYPRVPQIAGVRAHNIGHFFTTRPWNAVGWLPVGIYPFAVGLAFFIPLDLSFSCWFFYLFWKVQMIAGRALGLKHAFPYATEQSFGAYVGLGITAFWVSRKYLAQVARKVVGAKSGLDDSKEPFKYRTAVLCIVLCMIFLTAFCYKAGMSIWVILIFFGLFFILATGITRMRAELGSPVHDQHWGGPDEMMYAAFGTQRLGPNNLTILSYLFFFNRAYDWLTMPHQLEGLKIAERAGIDNKRFAVAMILATLIGIPVAIWAYLHTSYKFGVFTGFVGHESFNRLERWMTEPMSANYAAVSAVITGTIISFVLMFMRMRFFWFPLHAAGYAVSSTYTMNVFWFSIFVSFMIKWLILKHGKLKTYRRAIPFFLGLILGECVLTTFWGTLAIIVGRPMYITINL
ncbi:DUF6785 family protein [Candidatus Poribacteria bacterium]